MQKAQAARVFFADPTRKGGGRGRLSFEWRTAAGNEADQGSADHRIVRGSQSAMSGKIISSTVVTTSASIRMLQPL